jgi:hypothetical protein
MRHRLMYHRVANPTLPERCNERTAVTGRDANYKDSAWIRQHDGSRYGPAPLSHADEIRPDQSHDALAKQAAEPGRQRGSIPLADHPAPSDTGGHVGSYHSPISAHDLRGTAELAESREDRTPCGT